jgi:Flp pilus assembly protein TadG
MRPRKERGAAAVEFALIAPLLMTLLFGIIDFSYVMTKRSQFNQYAASAARLYTIELRDGATSSAAKAAAQSQFLSNIGSTSSTITFTWTCKSTSSTTACTDSTSCPSSTAGTPPTIVFVASMPSESLTKLFNGVMPKTTGEGVALCSYAY